MAEPSLCIIAHSHPDFTRGGGELAAYRHLETMRGAGHHAIFVAAGEIGEGQGLAARFGAIIPHAEDEYIFSVAGMAEDRMGWTDAYQRRRLVEFLSGLDVQVYHFHHYWRVGLDLIVELMAARPDATFVMTLHEMLAICMNHGQMVKTRSRELCRRESALRCLDCFPDETLERYTFRKATLLSVLRRFQHVVYPSEFIQTRYADWGLRDTPGSVIENYLGDTIMALPRGTAPTTLPSGAGLSRRFAFFGQPTPFKGLDVLLRALPLALREEPGLTLTIFGCEEADAERMFPGLSPTIHAAGESLAFAGRYDPLDAVELMRAMGWVIVPSIWWENSPVVIQEARRAGTPLIVSDIGGMAEKVQAGVDGLHFKRASPVDLARAMVEASRPEARQRLADSLRDVIGRDEFLTALSAAYTKRPESSAAATDERIPSGTRA